MASQPWVTFQVFEGLMVHVELRSSDVEPTCDMFRAEFMDLLQQVLDSGKPFTLFVDAREIGTVPMSVGIDIVKFMTVNRPKFKANCKASAIIMNPGFAKGLLEWVFALSPPVSPNVVVDDPSQGLLFLEGYMTPVIA
jgi:hypothetical protein